MARTGTRVELSNEMLEQLDRYRERDGRSRSAVIRAAIEQYLADERKAEIDRLILDGYRRMPQQDVGGSGSGATAHRRGAVVIAARSSGPTSLTLLASSLRPRAPGRHQVLRSVLEAPRLAPRDPS